MRLADRAAERQLLINPALRFGELYMDGRLIVTKGSLYEVLELGARNLAELQDLPWLRALEQARVAFRGLHQRNDRRRAKKNIARHYDNDARLYELFLDSDRQYSCAYFEHPGQSLDDAQKAKKRHIAAKLLLEDGASVLDIGCGFGGMALYLAGVADARVTGVTLSEDQFGVATNRARQSGFADRVEFRLQDYRDVHETFDRIVSVGMFEHVGVAGYDEYFQTVRRQLKDDGVMLLHAIGRNSTPGATNPWIRKYIFPGGYIPSLSEVLPAIERAGLYVTDIEILRLHYAETLRAWRERFMANRAEVGPHPRRALLPHVGILSGGVGDVVPRRRPHGLPDPARQAAGRGSPDARLHPRTRGRAAPPRSCGSRICAKPPSEDGLRVSGRSSRPGEADREAGDGDALQRDAVDIDAPDVVHLEPHVDDRVGARTPPPRASEPRSPPDVRLPSPG